MADTPMDLLEYANVADELTGDLTLDDLDSRYVRRARAAATKYDLSWPPTLAWEDEVRDAQNRLERRARALQVPEDPYDGLDY